MGQKFGVRHREDNIYEYVIPQMKCLIVPD